MKKIILIILISTIFFGCKKEETNSGFKPSITKLDLSTKIPASLQQNSPIAYNHIISMEAYMNLGASFMQMTGKKPVVDISNTTWTYGPYTINYDYNTVGNRYVFTYSIMLNGVEYYNINGWENIDASGGHWDYNINTSVLGMPTSSDYNIVFDWNRNSYGDYHFDMQFDMGATNLLHYTANINNDMSGNFNYTLNGDLYYSCFWDASGHGAFTNHTTTPPTVTVF
ncbi:MAG: hypothetical protein RL582_1629 [Bacteroidota bacterium]|jgi:hypothetical protein